MQTLKSPSLFQQWNYHTNLLFVISVFKPVAVTLLSVWEARLLLEAEHPREVQHPPKNVRLDLRNGALQLNLHMRSLTLD